MQCNKFFCKPTYIRTSIDARTPLLHHTHSKSVMFMPRYVFPTYNIAKQDFKGHQLKALRKLDSLKPQIQLICEIRDIRAPLSTRNVLIDKIIDKRFHEKLVIYTRKDLMTHNPEYLQKLSAWHEQIGENYIMINSKRAPDVANVLKTLQWYKKKYHDNLDGIPPPMGYKVLVSGMPNVGKSTLINSLRYLGSDANRGKKVARTGAEAGITRSTSELIRIGAAHDQLYLIDTPGIGLPGRLNVGNKMIVLSLCGCIKQGVIDPIIEADYLLFLMNLQRGATGRSSFLQWYPAIGERPSNDIYEVLERMRKNRKSTLEDLARSWIQRTILSHDLIFDKELLLPADDFSFRDYVRNEVASSASFGMSTENTRRTTRQNDSSLFRKHIQ